MYIYCIFIPGIRHTFISAGNESYCTLSCINNKGQVKPGVCRTVEYQGAACATQSEAACAITVVMFTLLLCILSLYIYYQ
jgi:hypothetical protein